MENFVAISSHQNNRMYRINKRINVDLGDKENDKKRHIKITWIGRCDLHPHVGTK